MNIKHPCKDIIKLIMQLNDGETISTEDMDEVRNTLEIYPQCKKYLDATGEKMLTSD